MKYIRGTYQEAELPELGEGEAIDTSIPADPNVKNYSYAIVDGQVYYRENSRMVRPDLNATAEARVKGLVGLRDCVQELIDLQMDAAVPDSTIREKQAELNSLYDSFSAKYGLINDRANRLAYADDSSYYLLCALEVIDEDGKLERKADMFTKRTIKPHQAVAVVDTASEALAVSISEKACVDMDYMSQLTGKTKEELAGELQGVIFRVPGQLEQDRTPHYVTADEYLSGNVRRKLRQAQRAAQQDPVYAVNVEALTAAQPKDLDASEIEVRLGATWIDKEYIQQFMYETFNTPFYLRRSIEVNYSSFTAEWQIKGKSSVSYNDVAAYTTYGTSRANAYKILEDSLNLRDVRIYDTIEDADGKERRVLNAKETTLAAQKQQAIREAFRDWIWRDPERRQTLVRQYNEEMNSTRPREYDGSHITFGGMNPAITLREHQKSAIAHVLYGGNTLLAHEVGAGKTFEMVAAAMEAKRLGLCQKSLFVVPNHLTEQWASEFLRLYPSANILVTTKKDFETHNRKKFCARIATGDYDAIIMGHSQFERIPISRERQERLLYEQMAFPLRHYRGISVVLDLELVSQNPPGILAESGIGIADFKNKFCADGACFVMRAKDEIEHIFSELYSVPDRLQKPYFMLKVQELLLFLCMVDVNKEKQRELYTSPQVEIVRDIHKRLISNLQERPTIEELSKEYLINTATLKDTFKGVYGQPIGTYMKVYRMKQAAALLRQTQATIAEIPKGVPVCLSLLSWAHAPFRWFDCCRLSGLYHTFRNRGNF